MKRFLMILGAALAALAVRPAAAAELQILEPKDHSVLRGLVRFQVKPQVMLGEQHFSDPEIRILDEEGDEVAELIAVLDTKSGVCSVSFDTTKLKDGLYTADVAYRTLLQAGKADDTDEVEESLTFGIRNGSQKPARFSVQLEEKPYLAIDPDAEEDEEGQLADITVRVLDQKGRPMPAARVTFKVDRGEADTDAAITDSGGEALVSVSSEEEAVVTLTITVENLPPVTRKIQFVKKK